MIAWLIRQSIFSVARYANEAQSTFVNSELAYKVLLFVPLEKSRWELGLWRAWHNADRAYRRVPAYRKFVNKNKGSWPRIDLLNGSPDLSVLPEMDKESYVKKYSNEERCIDGVIPKHGVVVDESSGSSGAPTSWIRGAEERKVSKQLLQLSYHAAVGKERIFVINAFALGAWATGMNVSMAMSEISIIKSTGPDLDKIVNTILMFGPKYHYVIMGYPPFLKTLADDERIDWKKFNVEAVFGGEGISESMRDYMAKTYKSIIGSYGASDLEINMAAENNLTIKLRQLILANEEFRKRVVHAEWGVTPMIFQYNPMTYYVESNDKHELVFSLVRSSNIAPKIRYNIHDRGHVIKYSDMVKILKEYGLWDEVKAIKPKLRLPFLLHYGRSDMSIDYYGANVTPDSVREILFGIDEVAAKLQSFRLMSYEDKKHNKRMRIAIELNKGQTAKSLDAKKIGDLIFPQLAKANRDFYNAMYKTATPDQYPEITFHEYATGPFEGGDRKLKKEYVTTKLKYDSL
jgi:phenylacetate-CoA ligase